MKLIIILDYNYLVRCLRKRHVKFLNYNQHYSRSISNPSSVITKFCGHYNIFLNSSLSHFELREATLLGFEVGRALSRLSGPYQCHSLLYSSIPFLRISFTSNNTISLIKFFCISLANSNAIRERDLLLTV